MRNQWNETKNNGWNKQRELHAVKTIGSVEASDIKAYNLQAVNFIRNHALLGKLIANRLIKADIIGNMVYVLIKDKQVRVNGNAVKVADLVAKNIHAHYPSNSMRWYDEVNRCRAIAKNGNGYKYYSIIACDFMQAYKHNGNGGQYTDKKKLNQIRKEYNGYQ